MNLFMSSDDVMASNDVMASKKMVSHTLDVNRHTYLQMHIVHFCDAGRNLHCVCNFEHLQLEDKKKIEPCFTLWAFSGSEQVGLPDWPQENARDKHADVPSLSAVPKSNTIPAQDTSVDLPLMNWAQVVHHYLHLIKWTQPK